MKGREKEVESELRGWGNDDGRVGLRVGGAGRCVPDNSRANVSVTWGSRCLVPLRTDCDCGDAAMHCVERRKDDERCIGHYQALQRLRFKVRDDGPLV